MKSVSFRSVLTSYSVNFLPLMQSAWLFKLFWASQYLARLCFWWILPVRHNASMFCSSSAYYFRCGVWHSIYWPYLCAAVSVELLLCPAWSELSASCIVPSLQIVNDPGVAEIWVYLSCFEVINFMEKEVLPQMPQTKAQTQNPVLKARAHLVDYAARKVCSCLPLL